MHVQILLPCRMQMIWMKEMIMHLSVTQQFIRWQCFWECLQHSCWYWPLFETFYYFCTPKFKNCETCEEICGIASFDAVQLLLFRYQHVLARPPRKWSICGPLPPWWRSWAQPQRVAICRYRPAFKFPVGNSWKLMHCRVSILHVIRSLHQFLRLCRIRWRNPGAFASWTASGLVLP